MPGSHSKAASNDDGAKPGHPLNASTLSDLGQHLFSENPSGATQEELFRNALQGEWRRCGTEAVPLTVLAIRVDGLGTLAAQPDHAGVRACMHAVAGTVRVLCIRRRDRVFLRGNDGFLALLPATHAEGAKHVASRIANAVRELQLPHPAAPSTPLVTVSVGGVVIVPTGDSASPAFAQHLEQALAAAEAGSGIHVINNCPPAQKPPASFREKLRALFSQPAPPLKRRRTD